MSPALVQKYFDAGKVIASHAVLLPDGFRFSAGTTRRDWENEILSDISSIYALHTSGDSDVRLLDRWSGADPTRSTENDGRIDLERYVAALIQYRERLLICFGRMRDNVLPYFIFENFLRCFPQGRGVSGGSSLL